MFKSIDFTPRDNIFHKYAQIAMISVIGFAVSLSLPNIIGAPLAILFVFAYAQFMYAAAKRCSPLNGPLLVRWLHNLERWWERFSEALQAAYHDGKPVYIRNHYMDFREIYDHTGVLIGTEQTIDWSMSDMGWQQGDPVPMELIYTEREHLIPRKMSWLSKLRSPKLTSVEITEHPITWQLNNRPDGHVTHLTMRAA